MKFDHLSVRARLSLAFGGLAALVLLVAGLAIKSLSDANERLAAFVDGIHARTVLANEVNSAVDRRAIAARNLVLVTQPEALQAEKAAVTKAHEEVTKNMAALKQLATRPEVTQEAKDLILRIDGVEQRYGPVALGIVQAALDGQRDAAITRMNDECRPLLAELDKASDAYAEYTEARAAQQLKDAQADYAAQRAWLIAG